MRHLIVAIFLVLVCLETVWAHGERAQQAGTRMRTINWYDITYNTDQVRVGENLILRGRFRTSKWWPEWLPSVVTPNRVFLNVATSGPNFVRTESSIDGVSMVQSTSLELDRDYEFEIVLKARRPGRFHVHPILNVEDAGGMVGPGRWIEIVGTAADFENKVTTMFGREITLETLNLRTIYTWHGLWFLVGGAWLFYWLRKSPILIPRFRAVEKAEEEGRDGDELISDNDRKVAAIFLVSVFAIIFLGYQWAESTYPVTTPLRTSKVRVPQKPALDPLVDVRFENARYRIPGRSFKMNLTITNNSSRPMSIAEFSTANVRFINPEVQTVVPRDSHDLVAAQGLRVESGAIAAGDTVEVTVYAEDALWETQRLVHMINDPDSLISGLLFLTDDAGGREVVEVGGTMVPVFN